MNIILRVFHFTLWLGLGIGFAGILQAQQPEYASAYYTVQQALPHPAVRAIVQDRTGFLWFGSENGLSRYNGFDLTSFNFLEDDTTSISGNNILCLFEDSDGYLWIGTTAGLNRMDPRTEAFTRYRHVPGEPQSLSENTVTSIFEDRTGVFWVGTMSGGLNRMDRVSGTFTHYINEANVPGSISDFSILSIFQDTTGLLWVGTRRGLNKFDPLTERFTVYRYHVDDPGSLSSNAVLTTVEDRSGQIWIGTLSGGLNRYERDRNRFFHYPRLDAGSRAVISIYEDDSGTLWIGTRDGLVFFDPVTGQYLHSSLLKEANSIGTQRIYTIYEDRSNVIWLGTSQGVSKIVRTPFLHIHHDPVVSNGLKNNRILALLEDRSEILWIGTNDGLEKLDRQTGLFFHYGSEFFHVPGLRGVAISALLEDLDGRLWIGAESGLFRLDRSTETMVRFRPQPQLSDQRSNLVLSLLESRDGRLLVGTGRGLYTFDRQVGTFASETFGADLLTDPGSNAISSLFEDHSGVIWIGTYAGLISFDPDAPSTEIYQRNRDDPQTLSDNRVLSVHEDHSGTIWIGTQGGLNRFDATDGTVVRYTTQQGLPHDVVYGLLSDERGRLWISTGKGLARLDPATETFVNFRDIDGLQGDTYSRGASFRTANGEMLFGGTNGFNIFDPMRIREDAPVPPVVLTSFEVRRHPYTPVQSLASIREIALEHNQNYFSIEFAVLHYRDPDHNRYAYMLEGLDPDWIESGSRRFVSYTNVPPGDYVFRVRGTGSNGVWNEEGLAVTVSVRPPFWKAKWFYVLCLLIGFVLLTYVRAIVNTRRLQIRSQELEESVAERTRDLLAEKQKTETQAQRLLDIERLKSRFFANVSHEFRTPLTLMLGPLDDALAETYGPLGKRLRDQLQMMRRNGIRLRNLINQLLDLSKLEVEAVQLCAEPRDLIIFVQDIVLSFSGLAEQKKITLQYLHEETTRPDLIVYFDADKLEKVIQNLLSNAFKFTPPLGKILVQTDERVGTSGSYAVIAVRDTGEGIAKSELPYVFDRFYQAESSTTLRQEGTGIGLALAKELVELHGGALAVESELGFGSTFTVQLPLSTGHLAADETAPGHVAQNEKQDNTEMSVYGTMDESEDSGLQEITSPADQIARQHPQAGAATVLVVDDNPDMRAYLKRHLQSIYHVAEASNGNEGLSLARTLRPDLVISDVMMPVMDGYALCRLLKNEADLAHIPVILLTAKADEAEQMEGLSVLADDYILKPFSMGALLARVENLIEIRQLLRRQYGGRMQVQPGDVSVDSAEHAFLERVRSMVEANLGNSKYGVEQLADHVGISTRQLQRKLRGLTRLSAAGYIRMMRLKRAAQLLEKQAGTVSEVAYQVGFRDVSHFSKLFKQTFGILPSSYRANGT